MTVKKEKGLHLRHRLKIVETIDVGKFFCVYKIMSKIKTLHFSKWLVVLHHQYRNKIVQQSIVFIYVFVTSIYC